jgi:hypothetical protein
MLVVAVFMEHETKVSNFSTEYRPSAYANIALGSRSAV